MVHRDESERAHVYSAASSEADVQGEIVGHLVDRVFAGSASKLVLRALKAKPVDEEELRAIRAMLDGLASDDTNTEES